MDGRWNARGLGIKHYLPDSGSDDLKNARRTVNITDKWLKIGGYYDAFLKALRKAGGVLTATSQSFGRNAEEIAAPTSTIHGRKALAPIAVAIAGLVIVIAAALGADTADFINLLMEALK